jgi:hypothetical protein
MVKYSFNAKLYYCVAGISETPTWTELSIVKDVTLSLKPDETDVTTRANAGFKAAMPTLMDSNIEFEMPWDTDNTGFKALLTAFNSRTVIGIACMDADITAAGSQGRVADMAIMDFTRSEKLSDVITAKVTLKPGYSVNAPQWKVVGAS